MSRIIWKSRYAHRIEKRSGLDWKSSVDIAEIALQDLGDDWVDEDPVFAADEEMSYWTD